MKNRTINLRSTKITKRFFWFDFAKFINTRGHFCFVARPDVLDQFILYRWSSFFELAIRQASWIKPMMFPREFFTKATNLPPPTSLTSCKTCPP